MHSGEHTGVLTFLFTDIDGSSRLWEEQPEPMRHALARHDAILRSAVERNGGVVVKSTGDGLHAAFHDPRDAIATAIELQRALGDPAATESLALRVRCGIHAGLAERRDGDFFGSPVNRAARIMSAAHGEQVLLSQAVASLLGDSLPPDTALRDLGAVRLRDLANPEHLYQLVHPELRQDFPALRSLEATPNNLPLQLTSFVGREHEQAELKSLLRNNRLLTLLGVGGIGKTRLSLQVAADVLEDYPDGVWFVELAQVTDERLVPQAIASVLGVKEEAGCPVLEALVKHVRDRQLLILLDNCEPLVRACAELAKQLLRAAPRLKIIGSSREHLHVAGEVSYPVPALTCPGLSPAAAPVELAQYEAVRLFVDRALAAQPTFQMPPASAMAVADICRRLDGIPLAIELAAARVRNMSVQEIAARLTDRFRLLARGDLTALPRQQTLRALIDWSHDLLTAQERVLFRRLGVFAGGFTIEAAEAVGAGGDLGEKDVLDVLTRLVEKSLVVLEAEGGRYRLLDTVRQYAEERLDESGEKPATRTRHLVFFLALAEKARSELVGPQQGAWLAKLDVERENLLTAHRWCDGAEGGAELGMRLVYGVQPFWIKRGFLELGHRSLAEALARAGAQTHSLVRCKALFAAGWVGYYMARYASARGYLEEGLSIAREIGDEAMVARFLQPLGMVSLGLAEPLKAREYLEEAVDLAQTRGDKHPIAAALNALAQLDRLEGDLDSAEELYAQVVALERELGDREGIAFALLNRAMALIGQRCADRVQPMLFEALAIADEIVSMPAGQSVLEVSAGLAALNEDWECSALFFGAAEALAAQTGLRRDPADEAFLAPIVRQTQAALGAAAFSAAEAIGRALTHDAAMGNVRAWLTAVAASHSAPDANS